MTFLGHTISPPGVRFGPRKVEALDRIPIPTDVSNSYYLLGGLSTCENFPLKLSTYIRPVPVLLKQHVSYCFTLVTGYFIRDLLCELCKAHVLTYPHRDAATDDLRPSRECCSARQNDLGVTLEQQQPDRTSHPFSRENLAKKRNWAIIGLKVGARACAIKILWSSFLGFLSVIVSDH